MPHYSAWMIYRASLLWTLSCTFLCVKRLNVYGWNGFLVKTQWNACLWAQQKCVCVCVCVHSEVEAGWLGVGCCYIFIAVSVYITLLLAPDLLSIPWESPSRSFCVSPLLDVVLCAFPSFFLSCSFVLALSFLLALPSPCSLSLSPAFLSFPSLVIFQKSV